MNIYVYIHAPMSGDKKVKSLQMLIQFGKNYFMYV